MEIIPFLVILGATVGYATSYFASLRGRNPLVWFALGAVFGAFALIALFLLPPIEKEKMVIKVNVPVTEPLKLKDWYYLDDEHQREGPYEFEQMQALFKQSRITGDTLVWSEGMENWTRIKEVSRLEQLL